MDAEVLVVCLEAFECRWEGNLYAGRPGLDTVLPRELARTLQKQGFVKITGEPAKKDRRS